MASYGDVTFHVLAEMAGNQLVFKDWDRGDNDATSRTKIPYANRSYVQQVGRSNPILTLKCEVYSDADYLALLAMRGDNIPRLLSDPFGVGWDYNQILLQRVFDAERVTYAEEWHFSLTFEGITV